MTVKNTNKNTGIPTLNPTIKPVLEEILGVSSTPPVLAVEPKLNESLVVEVEVDADDVLCVDEMLVVDAINELYVTASLANGSVVKVVKAAELVVTGTSVCKTVVIGVSVNTCPSIVLINFLTAIRCKKKVIVYYLVWLGRFSLKIYLLVLLIMMSFCKHIV